ncbi:FAD/NAD(P)-binding protein [Belliella marina]|uniref:FAD/NAD(P)-binding protein n=1 Tax=Belliella marina TaxID=1644146 RepID=A0ABW4VLF6_9BACT
MKIWNTSQLADLNKQHKKCIEGLVGDDSIPQTDFRVAIVGGGPRGSYAIERLASVWCNLNAGKYIDIVCFNAGVNFASGPNYLTDQPDYLLMNYHLGKVDFWTDEAEQLVNERLNLVEFLERFKLDPNETVDPTDYCTRALTGVYLQYCLCKVIESLPEYIRLHLVVGEVNSIGDGADGLLVQTKQGYGKHFSEVICCTGHSYSFGNKMPDEILDGQNHNQSSSLVTSVYPIHQLEHLDYEGKTVIVKGIGLTFVDAVLAMTEGQGGCFEKGEDGLTYIPSGKEPLEILPFSRSGLPMVSRQNDLDKDGFSLKFFTDEVVSELSDSNRSIDFKHEVLPLIDLEFRFQYVLNLLNHEIGLEIDPSTTLQEMEVIAENRFPKFKPFDLELFLSPKSDTSNLNKAVNKYMKTMLFPERYGKLLSATVAMSGLWREIYPLFKRLYSFGKLSGESHRYFDRMYANRFQRVSYGPPKVSMEKILALQEAGIIHFDFAADPKVSWDGQTFGYKLSHKENHQSKIAHLFIDARIPKSAGLDTQPKYIKQLVEQSEIGFFTNEKYKTGCLEMDRMGRLHKYKHICFYGVPTEGWTLDNESLSRTNNNFLSPWAKQISLNYDKLNNPKIDTYSGSLDNGLNWQSGPIK